MKIRTITFFIDPNNTDWDAEVFRLSQFSKEGKALFQREGIEVQTCRLATRSFCEFLPLDDPQKALEQVRDFAEQSVDGGFDYLALGPAQTNLSSSYDLIPFILENTENIFMSGHMVDPNGRIHLPSVRACARVIERAALISPDGFANLRFTALANVQPHTPFFPAAYHDDALSGFALAIESADIAITAMRNAKDIAKAQQALRIGLESAAGRISAIALELTEKWGIPFYGMDFSYAPFPDASCSLGGAVEMLGPEKTGQVGSLAAAAILADSLDAARWQKTGFNGLMMPVLEDSVLAQRSKDGTLTVKDLLMYSAVCGTGLDTVPLPGSATADDLTGLLLDIAALAVRLNKPLTARLMPIPGKAAGDDTSFDFGFFANGKVLDLPAGKLNGLLGGDGLIEIHSRNWYANMQ
jgi:uncharacterized protein (UPF0210 family)